MKKRYWIIIVSAVILLAAAVGLVIWLCNKPSDNSNDSDTPTDPPQPYLFGTIYEDQLYYPILNGQQAGAPFRNNGKQTSKDRSITCVNTSDDGLLIFTKAGRKLVANSVSQFVLDDNGKFIIYYSGKTLYRYRVNAGKSDTLLENVSKYILSADRKTIVYVNDSNEVILKTGNTEKTITVLQSNAGLAGVSNDGDHIYITVEKYPDSTLYHYDSNGTVTEILRYDSTDVIEFCCFANKAQFFLSTINEAYVSTDGQPAVKLTDYWVQPVSVFFGREDNMNDLRNWAYWTAKGEILYVTDDPATPITLVQDADTARCDPSGRYVWYAKNNKMMRLDTQYGADAEKNAVVIVEALIDLTELYPYGSTYRDILDMDMRFSEDCKQIAYFRGTDLYLLDAMNGGEMKLIAKAPTRYCTWLENGILFYLKENILYSYRDGVSTEIKTNVESISNLNPGYLYAKCGEEYYITNGSTSYTITLRNS